MSWGKEKNVRAIIAVFAALVFLLLYLLAACSGGGGISLDKTSVTMEEAESVQLTAAVDDGVEVSWETSNETVATVSGEGLVTAVGIGSATITASGVGKNGKSVGKATCQVTVNEADVAKDLPVEGLSLVWRDEFEGTELDTTKWGYQIGTHDVYHGIENSTMYWGNSELQYYTEDAVTVEDGNLVITAKRQDYEDMEYTSARILTRDLASFTYGYFEVKMKTPAITGMWPAFWMLPQPTDYTADRNVYGTWAANGEIDIMEAKGREQNIVSTTLHYGGNWPQNTYSTSTYTLSSNTDEWHTYAIYWEPTGMTWYIDGEAVFSLESSQWWTTSSSGEEAPFDVPFYMILNLAVGGTFDGGKKPSDDFTSASMYVDYVRVFQSEEYAA